MGFKRCRVMMKLWSQAGCIRGGLSPYRLEVSTGVQLDNGPYRTLVHRKRLIRNARSDDSSA